MYETFFQMEHTPFSRNTPVADLYESPAMADTLGACLCGGPPALCGSHCGCRLWEIHAHPPVCDQPAQRGIPVPVSVGFQTDPRVGSIKGCWISWGSSQSFTAATQSGSSRRKWRSSAASRKRKWSASWMRPIF